MAVQPSVPTARTMVALIDSKTDVRRAVQLRLQARQFDVRAYASGWNMLADEGQTVDCIVTRDRMVDIGGFELLRRLRARGWQGPAILVTDIPGLEFARLAAHRGFAMVVDRPLVDDLIVNAVEVVTRTSPEIVA